MELARISNNTQLDPMTVAQVFRASNMFPDIQSEAAACTKIIIGRGLGLSDFDAMTGLHIIKGKAVLASNLMAAAIKRAGKYDYRANCTDTECSIVFFGRNAEGAWEEIGDATFTLEDAKRARLAGNENWQKYPKAMLFARCISAGYKQHCPDALGAAPVYVEAHGETEITDDAPAPVQARGHEAPKARAALEAAQPATIDAEASVVKVQPEAAPAPAKPAEAKPSLLGWPKKGTAVLTAIKVVNRDQNRSAVLFSNDDDVKQWVSVDNTMLGGAKLNKPSDVDFEWDKGGYFVATRVRLLTAEEAVAREPLDF